MAAKDSGASPDKPRRARQGLILAVERDPGVQDIIRQALQRDYELISLNDTFEFTDAVEAYNPDLIILGSGLSDRQADGYQLYRQFRAHAGFQDIPVLFLAPVRADPAFTKALANHGDASLTKPFGQKTIKDLVARLILY
jgi:PleD family two-component response regulator